MRRLAALLLIVVAFVAPYLGAEAVNAEDAFPFPIHSTVLDNGFTVLTVPYDSPGTVAFLTLVRTGSRDEVEAGHSGFAHFFEHMMFRGTDKYSETAYNGILKRMGVDSNADTSDDRTRYYLIGPSAEVETMMDIESDRFQNLKYSEDDFKREALAVLGEYNKSASSPFLPLWERMRDLAFDDHTYEHTTIGFLEDIQAMPTYYDYSLGFFDRFYRPENCILVVAGDVDPAQIASLAERYWGSWERGYQAPDIDAEPEQTEARTDDLDWPSEIRPHFMTGYRAPAFNDHTVDTAALDIIGQLLFSESAPLYQKLVVEEQWVDFVSGSYSDHRDPFLFMIYARAKSDEAMGKVDSAIAEAIENLKTVPISQERLNRIQSHLRYSFAAQLDTPGAVAFTLANYLTLTGDPETPNRIQGQYANVTPADIQRMAQIVFQPKNRTHVTLSHKVAAEEAR